MAGCGTGWDLRSLPNQTRLVLYDSIIIYCKKWSGKTNISNFTPDKIILLIFKLIPDIGRICQIFSTESFRAGDEGNDEEAVSQNNGTLQWFSPVVKMETQSLPWPRTSHPLKLFWAACFSITIPDCSILSRGEPPTGFWTSLQQIYSLFLLFHGS